MGTISEKISISGVLKSLGVKHVVTKNPFDLGEAIEAVKDAAAFHGVSAIIFEAPCIAVAKPSPVFSVDSETCTGCKKCVRELGCPAIVKDGAKVRIDPGLCYGCSLCVTVCPFEAIGGDR